jgi:hypothetical protein
VKNQSFKNQPPREHLNNRLLFSRPFLNHHLLEKLFQHPPDHHSLWHQLLGNKSLTNHLFRKMLLGTARAQQPNQRPNEHAPRPQMH